MEQPFYKELPVTVARSMLRDFDEGGCLSSTFIICTSVGDFPTNDFNAVYSAHNMFVTKTFLGFDEDRLILRFDFDGGVSIEFRLLEE